MESSEVETSQRARRKHHSSKDELNEGLRTTSINSINFSLLLS